MSTDERGRILGLDNQPYRFPCTLCHSHTFLVATTLRLGWFVLTCGHGYVKADDDWLVADLARDPVRPCQCAMCVAVRAGREDRVAGIARRRRGGRTKNA